MAKRTKKRLTIDGIIACGYTETFRSSKYRTFLDGIGGTWMVGRAGALRHTTGPLFDSQSLTGERVHKAFQYVGGLGNRGTLGKFTCLRILAAHVAGTLEELDETLKRESSDVGAAT